MAYQVQIDPMTKIATGISETIEPIISDEYIQTDSFDFSFLGKKYNNGVWEDVPYIQVQIDPATKIALAIVETINHPVVDSNFILVDSADESIIGKRFANGGWEEVLPTPVLLISKVDFWNRFTADERVAIQASEDAYVKDFLNLINMSSDIRLDETNIAEGTVRLEMIGLLSQGRAQIILTPEMV